MVRQRKGITLIGSKERTYVTTMKADLRSGTSRHHQDLNLIDR